MQEKKVMHTILLDNSTLHTKPKYYPYASPLHKGLNGITPYGESKSPGVCVAGAV